MMPQKRLDELLREDQEPFLLNNYIADRRTHLRPSSINRLQKRKPFSQTHNFPDFFRKNACFLSPDQRKSPILAANTPCRIPKNAIFLHIPAPNTALLIEAALRILKHTNTPKHQGCGIFRSILKKLRNRNLKWDSCVGRKRKTSDEIEDLQKNGGNGSSPSSGVWSERNEEKSVESAACGDLGLCEDGLPLSPSSPAASPCHPVSQESERLKKLQGGGDSEEDKEQCSPVSVLDVPFEDDEDEDSFDVQGSYAIVQRAKRQLLHKIQRFEKLASLDPIELDKRMLENDDDDQEDQQPNYREDFRIRSFHQDWKIPKYMHLLVSDLDAEEEKQQVFSDDQETMTRVLKRLESWKDVESNTIDMMVDQDFRREYGAWNQNQQQVKETAAQIELHIFGLLVEELFN